MASAEENGPSHPAVSSAHGDSSRSPAAAQKPPLLSELKVRLAFRFNSHVVVVFDRFQLTHKLYVKLETQLLGEHVVAKATSSTETDDVYFVDG